MERRSIWKGDLMVGDIEALENMDALEIRVRGLNAKEVFMPKMVKISKFLVADGTVKL